MEQWQPLLSFFHSEVRPSSQVLKLPSKLRELEAGSKKATKKGDSAHQSKRPRMDTCVPATNTAPSPGIQKRQDGKVLNREERLFMFLSSDVNRVYCGFLLSVIPEFEKMNVLLQSGAPQIHLLREILHNLLRDLMLRFFKPSVIKRTDVVTDIDYKSFDNQRVGLDIVGPFKTSRGYKYITVAIDYLTKFVEAKPVRNIEAVTLQEFIERRIILKHGYPAVIITDHGTQMMARSTSAYLQHRGIQHSPMTAHHLAANDLCKRAKKKLKQMINFTTAGGDKWANILPYVVFCYDTGFQDTVCQSPFFLVYGHDPVPLMSFMAARGSLNYMMHRTIQSLFPRD
ncbi:DDE-type integrase/transposase/recombinase [Ixodes scapularis]